MKMLFFGILWNTVLWSLKHFQNFIELASGIRIWKRSSLTSKTVKKIHSKSDIKQGINYTTRFRNNWLMRVPLYCSSNIKVMKIMCDITRRKRFYKNQFYNSHRKYFMYFWKLCPYQNWYFKTVKSRKGHSHFKNLQNISLFQTLVWPFKIFSWSCPFSLLLFRYFPYCLFHFISCKLFINYLFIYLLFIYLFIPKIA